MGGREKGERPERSWSCLAMCSACAALSEAMLSLASSRRACNKGIRRGVGERKRERTDKETCKQEGRGFVL